MKNIKSYNRSYLEIEYLNLIKERENLIEKIKKFEKKFSSNKLSSSESGLLIYKRDLLSLSNVCVTLSKINFHEGSSVNQKIGFNTEWMYILEEYLIKSNLFNTFSNNTFEQRVDGKKFIIKEHVRALILSLLSNQRPWKGIASHIDKIEEIFYYFDIEKIKSTKAEHFIKRICDIKCGNRDIKLQMQNLNKNIILMENIEEKFITMDNFVTSAPAYEIVRLISSQNSKYKFMRVGEALAWEYLRNVGIDGAKPDVHLCRFFSNERMGLGTHSPAKVEEVYNIVSSISKETGYSMAKIDSLIWIFCSSGYGEICTATPKCEVCPIRYYCNKI